MTDSDKLHELAVKQAEQEAERRRNHGLTETEKSKIFYKLNIISTHIEQLRQALRLPEVMEQLPDDPYAAKGGE